MRAKNKKDYSELFKRKLVKYSAKDISPEEFSERLKDYFRNMSIEGQLVKIKKHVTERLKENGYTETSKGIQGEDLPDNIEQLYEILIRAELTEEYIQKGNIEGAVLNALWLGTAINKNNLISLRWYIGVGLDCEKGSLKSGDKKRIQVADKYHTDWDEWQRIADEYWKRNPNSTKMNTAIYVLEYLKAEHSEKDYPSVNTIRLRIKKSY